jgi:hypothetical protein
MITAIDIDFEPFAESKWYSGTYSVVVGESITEYVFTLSVAMDLNTGTDPFNIEVVWTDEKPSNIEEVNKAIIEYFDK